MLHSVFGILLAALWAAFTLWTLVSLWRTLRRRGPRAALAMLTGRQFVLPLVLMVTLTVIRFGIVFIYPQQVGVVVSVLADEGVREKPLLPGLHWVWPLAENVVRYDRSWQTYTMSNRPYEGQHPDSDAIVARTKDNQEILLDVSVIHRVDPEQVVDLHRFWQNRYQEELLRPAVRSLIRGAAARYTVDEVNSERRADMAADIDGSVTEVAAENGLIVRQVLLRNLAFTKEYAAAVEQKQSAMEGETMAGYRAAQVEALARGEASKITIIADAEAAAVRIKAEARAAARLIRAKAEAQALDLVAGVLKDKQELLAYRYITKLSPSVQAVVLPNNMPLIFPLPSLQPPGTQAAPLRAAQAVPAVGRAGD